MSTRQQLEQWAARWLHRTDFTADDLTACIQAVTSDLGSRLKSDANESRLVVAAGYDNGTDLTELGFEGFASMRHLSVSVNGGPRPLESANRTIVDKWLHQRGEPAFYSVDNEELWLAPFQSSQLTAYYYAKPPEVPTDAQGTTEVLSTYPDLYRYGTLAQCSLITQDMELVESYGNLYEGRLAELNAAKRWKDMGDKPQARRA